MLAKCKNWSRDNVHMELLCLLFLGIIIFLLSVIQVDNMLTIWNQNDEFGVWQGAAWVLRLDWSEITSTNGFYGQGYGYLLAPFLFFFGNDSVKMTHFAVYFQAFYHTSTIFIAYYCVNRLFPQMDGVKRILISCMCILTIPDLFYVYMFFAENLLRFIVWCIVGLVVSYAHNAKWYKLLLINAISIYAFSVHQRCILLVGMSMFFFIIQCIRYLITDSKKWLTLIKIFFVAIATVVFYLIAYKYTQESYITFLYGNSQNGVRGNLLSERELSLKGILEYFCNIDSIKTMFLQLCGCIYYFSAYDCGFALFGFISVLLIMKKCKNKLFGSNALPYLYIGCLAFGAIMLTVFQNAQWGVSNRVEANHYGRYFSYTLSPIIMLGIAFLFSCDKKIIRKATLGSILLFAFSGLITHNLIVKNEVTSLFAFSNACPGINSIYSSDGPATATLYHTVLGVVWILVPAALIMYAANMRKYQNVLFSSLFCCIALLWVSVGNREAKNQYDAQKPYVVDTYDLQNILSDQSEFAVFKSFGRYGSGLIQYNNIHSKIHVYDELDDFMDCKEGLYVVSQKGLEEMDKIKETYEVIYENNRYFIWVYQS